MEVVTGDAFLEDLNAAVPIVQQIPRVRFEVGLADAADRWIRKKHANGAVHEPATLAAFMAIGKQRGAECRRIFDVGALWGYFSLFALMVFEDAEVTAFEAHPAAMQSLVANVVPQVNCVYAAVSDFERPNTRVWVSGMNLYEEPAGGWENLPSVPGAMKPRGENNRGSGFMKVNFTTLDAWCVHSGDVPDLIKIDVEGYQAKAILGAVATLRTHKPAVVIELHDPEKLARFGVTNAQTVQPLFDLGYRAYWCGNHRARDASFERVHAMDERHEKLSIMVFVPHSWAST